MIPIQIALHASIWHERWTTRAIRRDCRGYHRTKDIFEFPRVFFSSFSDEHTHARTRYHPASSFRKRYRTRGTGLYHPRYRVFSRLYCRKSLSTSLGSHTCHKRYRGWMPTRNHLLRRHQRKLRVFSRVVSRRGHLFSADDIVSAFAIIFFVENGISRIMRKLKRKYVAFGSTGRMPGSCPAGDGLSQQIRASPTPPSSRVSVPPQSLVMPPSTSTTPQDALLLALRRIRRTRVTRIMLPFFACLSVSVDYLPSAYTRRATWTSPEISSCTHPLSGTGTYFSYFLLPVNSESLSACSEISILSVTERAELEEVEPELKAESRRLIALNTCHLEITLWFTPRLPNTPFSLNIFSSPLFTE